MKDSINAGGEVVAELLAAGRAMAATPVNAEGGHQYAVVPRDYRLERLEMPPAYVKRTVAFTDVDSFKFYVNKYKLDSTLIFAQVTDVSCELRALLDYHGDTVLEGGTVETGWFSHVAELKCVLTKDWQVWMGRNGKDKPFTQVEFAQFLEDNERLFRSPGAAELLELVTTLEGKSNVRFNSAVRLQNGKARLDFEEDVALQGGVGTGAIEVPKELILAIIPFENGPVPYEVRARLRYRIQSRTLVFWYETVTPHLVLRDAARAVMEAVKDKLELPILIGS